MNKNMSRKLFILFIILGTLLPTVLPGILSATAKGAPAATGSIQWGTCPTFDGTSPPATLECGTLAVPLDYGQPNGEKINVAVSRLKARKASMRHGVLLLNPGGPGGPGLDMPLWMSDLMPQSVLDRYDLIGFDPRGVGRSAPVSCGLNELQGFEIAPPFEQPGGFNATATFMQQAAQGCGQNSGAHLPYITTANTARDMDQIRQALGEAKVSYWGLSYGTYLGAVYATLFPSSSDRFVLDSSTDPTANWRETFRRFGQADESRFPDFAQFVASNNADYGLGATQAEVRATYFQLFDKVSQHPIPLPCEGVPGLTLNGPWFRALSFVGLEADSAFAPTAQLWKAVKNGQDPCGGVTQSAVKTLMPARSLVEFPDVPVDNPGASTNAVVCDDVAWSRSVSQYQQELNADTARYPMFGPVASNIWPCAFWPNQPIEQPVTITSNGPSNIMIVQNQRDPNTPYANALQMKAALGARARFISVVQGGHGASYGTDNDCSRETVTNYLVTGNLPASDFTCAAEPMTPLTPAAETAAKQLRKRM